MSENKRFEDWVKVDCNECARYWDSSCDGAKEERHCTSYLATRSIVIPALLNTLEKRLNWLKISVFIAQIVVLIHLVVHLIN